MKFQSYLCSPPTYVYNCRAVNTHITLLSNKNPWETNFIFFSLQEAARLAFLKASEGLVNLCALNIMSLLPFVLLNFRGGYHYSDKISTKVSSAQEFWLRLKDSGQREAALLWQGFTHTDQQETATSFFFESLGSSSWEPFYLPCTAGYVGDVTVGHHIVASVWTNTCTYTQTTRTTLPRPWPWKHGQLQSSPSS